MRIGVKRKANVNQKDKHPQDLVAAVQNRSFWKIIDLCTQHEASKRPTTANTISNNRFMPKRISFSYKK